ncbi:amino acid adenylation domain-containing protein [Streptomyces sp. SAI-133]|jgi:amino acid adenylation domain-containing protein|uniref:amino acid adenylation domain-containing protein n=2 Tax=unclassified Streptomyces TaxID=2593676 RepID=UPI0032AEB883
MGGHVMTSLLAAPPAAEHAKSVHEAFAAQAARSPDDVAVRSAGRELTYQEVDQAANRLAHRLLRLGVVPETPVAILTERTTDVVVAILAVLKAGGVYLPLHSGFPRERMEWILRTSGVPVLLTDRATSASPLPAGRHTTVVVDDDPHVDGLPATDPAVASHPDRLAYIMFTSGSTGLPKGVGVTHGDVVALATDPLFATGHRDRVLMIAPYAFDVFTYEAWVPLLHGGTTVIAATTGLDAATLAQTLAAERITGLHVTAGLFRVVAEAAPEVFAGLREVLTGGDVVSPAAVRKVLEHCPNTAVRAMYGPTETTLFATHHKLNSAEAVGASVPIGLPLDGVRVYILDAKLAVVDAGTAGELYIAGAGVARGYHGRSALTAERFVPDPFGPPGSRMYRTGDMARSSADGTLEFLGRLDDQVKIRGFRVELPEIESVLASHPDLSDVAVVAREVSPGDKRLVAYVVGRTTSDSTGLRDFLAAKLPEYMVPSVFVRIDELPLTPNGKLDYRALPEPIFEGPALYRGPRTAQEQILCTLFAEVLGAERVGIDDSFFDLGGHSLLATRLVSHIRAVLGVRLSMRSLLDAPTAAGLARLLFDGGQDSERALGPVLTLRSAGSRAPLFCVHPGSGTAWCYSGLLRYIPGDHPVYGLQARGLAGGAKLPSTLAEMTEDYLGQIRRIQATGPYHLAGWSFGGTVAHSLAVRLQEQGEDVAFLGVLDSRYDRLHGTHRAVTSRELLTLAFDGIDSFRLEAGDGPLPPSRVLEILRERPGIISSLDERTVAAVLEITSNNLTLNAGATPAAFDGDLLFVEATGADGEPSGLADYWKPYVTGRIDRQVAPVDHLRMMTPQALSVIGPMLTKSLKEISS